MNRYGRQEPTFEHVGSYAYSEADSAVSMFEQYGFSFMPWQIKQFEYLFARTPQGKVAARSLAMSVPRQNGKSFAVRLFALFMAMVCGWRVMYSVHRGDTASEFFQMLKVWFDEETGIPDWCNELVRIVNQTGREAFEFKSGGKITFNVRSRNLKRGSSLDLIIIDEAQTYTAAMMAGLQSTTLSNMSDDNPSGQFQVVYLGTPPTPEDEGDVFKSMHDTAHKKDTCSATWWIEWAALELPPDNTTAEQLAEMAWETNPALGYRMNPDAVLEAARTAIESGHIDVFARENLGWWSSAGVVEHVISAAAWNALVTKTPPRDGVTCYGVKIAPDDSEVALAAARRFDVDGVRNVYTEILDVRAGAYGISWVVDYLRDKRNSAARVVIDGKNGSDALAQRLRDDCGYPTKAVDTCSPSEISSAAANLRQMITDGTLSHYGQGVLDNSATGATKRIIGNNGAWAFGNGTDDSTPIEAVSLAVYEAYTTKRDPTRKARLVVAH